jgi:hypothetical protein
MGWDLVVSDSRYPVYANKRLCGSKRENDAKVQGFFGGWLIPEKW